MLSLFLCKKANMFKSIVFMPIVFEYIKDTFLFQISGILGVGTTDLALPWAWLQDVDRINVL